MDTHVAQTQDRCGEVTYGTITRLHAKRTVNGVQHLKVLEQIPVGKKEWQPVSDKAWMPFDGGPSNGGQWLHSPEGWAKLKGSGMDDACRRF